MKKNIFIIVALLAGIGLSCAIFFNRDADALHVNQVAADPSSYAGTVTVTGIMAGIAPQDPTVFGIFDLKELKCKTPNCEKLYLPVTYQGTMPKRGDEVRVSGRFVKTDGGYILAASYVKVVKNHRIGA